MPATKVAANDAKSAFSTRRYKVKEALGLAKVELEAGLGQ